MVSEAEREMQPRMVDSHEKNTDNKTENLRFDFYFGHMVSELN